MFKSLLIAGMMLTSYSAFSADCPVQQPSDNFLDAVGMAIKATASCEEGAEVASACALTASGDTQIAAAAERKCGLDFWKKLSSSEKKTYNGLQAKCTRKYKDSQGSMYISFAAFCRLNVARLYSELYKPVE